jgi:hypothetical protein
VEGVRLPLGISSNSVSSFLMNSLTSIQIIG